jgi:flagellar basal body rod protein FlgG
MGLRFYHHSLCILSLLTLSACLSPSASPGGVDSQAMVTATMNLVGNHQQSPIVSDQQPLHWAIDGVGYFAVIDKKTGERLLTRKGDFVTDANGQMTTADGQYFLEPAITLPPGSTQYYIDEIGTVRTLIAENGIWTELGRITLTRVPYPDKLTALGGRDGYFKVTQAAGMNEEGQAGQNMFGRVVGGAFEDFSQAAQKLPDGPCKLGLGKQVPTDKNLDVAIDGDGYFVLMSSVTGESLYTRQGAFQVNGDKHLFSLITKGAFTNHQGYMVEIQAQDGKPQTLHLSDNQTLDRIDEKGTLFVKEGEEVKAMGRLVLAKIQNKELLEPVGFARQNVFRAKTHAPLSKTEIATGLPTENGLGALKPQMLEACGLDVLNYPESP